MSLRTSFRKLCFADADEATFPRGYESHLYILFPIQIRWHVNESFSVQNHSYGVSLVYQGPRVKENIVTVLCIPRMFIREERNGKQQKQAEKG
jgi:hypothetical protein